MANNGCHKKKVEYFRVIWIDLMYHEEEINFLCSIASENKMRK